MTFLVTDHNSVFGDTNSAPLDDAKITVKPAEQQQSIHSEVTARTHSVANDFISTMHGVTTYADSGATRAVMRHLGPAQGYEASSAPTLLRAGEFQTLRAAGTEGGAWGMEVGVHSEVAGDGWSKNLGIYIASSHAGWLPSGVKADTAIFVAGEDGWQNVLIHLNEAGNRLYNIRGDGSVWMNGYLAMPNMPFFCAQILGTCSAGQDAKVNPISAHGMTHDNSGASGGSRIFAPVDGTYEVSFSGNAIDSNTQVLLTKNGGVIPWGGAANAGCQISSAALTLKMQAGEFITIRCNNGRFGQNENFSNVSVRKVG